MAEYRILSLDGGGIRGLYTAVLLERLEEAVPGWLQKVDLVAGTSTGGILALGLADGMTPAELVELYRKNGERIFRDSFLDDVMDLGGLVGADYSNKNLKRVVRKTFGKTKKLKDLGKRVLVPAFDLDNLDREPRPGEVRFWKAKFFHNFPGPQSDGEELVVDVALRTSAAPTYFPSYQGYIDGGVVANNPSTAALAQALDQETGKQSLEAIRLLSLGTGFNPEYITGKSRDWGFGQWGRPLVSLMIDGVMGVADYESQHLLRDRYHRLCPRLPEKVDMDDTSKIDELIQYAQHAPQADMDGAIAWLATSFCG